MASTGGKRAGARRGTPSPRPPWRRLLLLAGGVTLSMVAWGYLVYAAIDFGSSARDGRGLAWVFLGLASLGAVACLFVGLVLVSHLLRALRAPGTVEGSRSATEDPGGRRAAR